jgi:hypothetical protein
MKSTLPTATVIQVAIQDMNHDEPDCDSLMCDMTNQRSTRMCVNVEELSCYAYAAGSPVGASLYRKLTKLSVAVEVSGFLAPALFSSSSRLMFCQSVLEMQGIWL